MKNEMAGVWQYGHAWSRMEHCSPMSSLTKLRSFFLGKLIIWLSKIRLERTGSETENAQQIWDLEPNQLESTPLDSYSWKSISLRGRKRQEPYVKSPITEQEGSRHVDQWCPPVLLKGDLSHETEVRSFINAEIALQHATTRLVC